jgi:hypothetical protein
MRKFRKFSEASEVSEASFHMTKSEPIRIKQIPNNASECLMPQTKTGLWRGFLPVLLHRWCTPETDCLLSFLKDTSGNMLKIGRLFTKRVAGLNEA